MVMEVSKHFGSNCKDWSEEEPPRLFFLLKNLGERRNIIVKVRGRSGLLTNCHLEMFRMV